MIINMHTVYCCQVLHSLQLRAFLNFRIFFKHYTGSTYILQFIFTNLAFSLLDRDPAITGELAL